MATLPMVATDDYIGYDASNAQIGPGASAYFASGLDLVSRYWLPRAEVFRALVDSKIDAPNHNSNVYTVTVNQELGPLGGYAGSVPTLDEVAFDEPVDKPTPRTFSIQMYERGNWEAHTDFGILVSWDKAFKDSTVRALMKQCSETVDKLVRVTLDDGTNKLYYDTTGTPDNGFTTTAPAAVDCGVMNAQFVSACRTRLESRDAEVRGDGYTAVAHPDVLFDILHEGGPGGGVWSYQSARAYTNPNDINKAKVTNYLGVNFMTSSQATKAGTSPNFLYNTYFVGREALMEIVKVEPHFYPGPIIDVYKRVYPLVWRGVLGHTIFRNNALEIAVTRSSLGAVTINQATLNRTL